MADEKLRQETENLRLTEEKLKLELAELRRPYILRNPQMLTALITSVGSIIGVSILIGHNYCKTRDELNNLQAEKTARLEQDAKRATEDSDRANQRAQALMTNAQQTEATAKTTILATSAARIFGATRERSRVACRQSSLRVIPAMADHCSCGNGPSA
jgi:hypothetical protein